MGYSPWGCKELDVTLSLLSFTRKTFAKLVNSTTFLCFMFGEIWLFHRNMLFNECNCAVVWEFFSIAFLWDWNEN